MEDDALSFLRSAPLDFSQSPPVSASSGREPSCRCYFRARAAFSNAALGLNRRFHCRCVAVSVMYAGQFVWTVDRRRDSCVCVFRHTHSNLLALATSAFLL